MQLYVENLSTKQNVDFLFKIYNIGTLWTYFSFWHADMISHLNVHLHSDEWHCSHASHRLLNDKERYLEPTSVQRGLDQCQRISLLGITCSLEKCLTQTCTWELILDQFFCKYFISFRIQVCNIVTFIHFYGWRHYSVAVISLLVHPCDKSGCWAQVSCKVLFQVNL